MSVHVSLNLLNKLEKSDKSDTISEYMYAILYYTFIVDNMYNYKQYHNINVS